MPDTPRPSLLDPLVLARLGSSEAAGSRHHRGDPQRAPQVAPSRTVDRVRGAQGVRAGGRGPAHRLEGLRQVRQVLREEVRAGDEPPRLPDRGLLRLDGLPRRPGPDVQARVRERPGGLARLPARPPAGRGRAGAGLGAGPLGAAAAGHGRAPHARSWTRSRQCQAEGPTELGAAVDWVIEHAPRRSSVLVFSDLMDREEKVLKRLGQLGLRKHEVTLFHVLDPAELEFPFEDPTLFLSMEDERQVEANGRDMRKGYLELFGRWLDEVAPLRLRVRRGLRACAGPTPRSTRCSSPSWRDGSGPRHEPRLRQPGAPVGPPGRGHPGRHPPVLPPAAAAHPVPGHRLHPPGPPGDAAAAAAQEDPALHGPHAPPGRHRHRHRPPARRAARVERARRRRPARHRHRPRRLRLHALPARRPDALRARPGRRARRARLAHLRGARHRGGVRDRSAHAPSRPRSTAPRSAASWTGPRPRPATPTSPPACRRPPRRSRPRRRRRGSPSASSSPPTSPPAPGASTRPRPPSTRRSGPVRPEVSVLDAARGEAAAQPRRGGARGRARSGGRLARLQVHRHAGEPRLAEAARGPALAPARHRPGAEDRHPVLHRAPRRRRGAEEPAPGVPEGRAGRGPGVDPRRRAPARRRPHRGPGRASRRARAGGGRGALAGASTATRPTSWSRP